ncbi:MAG: hypothetical protein HWN81_06330 [Candidatus Lokiarchaeota archaeon]|nr:hypothetical protein [Candidatus Lokiarchaeota archaeon]
MGMYTLVLSLLWIFVTEIMFVSDFEAYTGISYNDYLVSDPRFAELYIITKKMIGIMLCGIGLSIIIITHYGYEKGEKWAWYALLIIGGIPWLTFIVYKIIIGYIEVSMITFVLGAALYAIGIAFPAEEILGKK